MLATPWRPSVVGTALLLSLVTACAEPPTATVPPADAASFTNSASGEVGTSDWSSYVEGKITLTKSTNSNCFWKINFTNLGPGGQYHVFDVNNGMVVQYGRNGDQVFTSSRRGTFTWSSTSALGTYGGNAVSLEVRQVGTAAKAVITSGGAVGIVPTKFTVTNRCPNIL